MTTTPNKEMSEIHNRMPVILSKTHEDAWLEATDDDEVADLLMPYKNGGLETYEVSTDVNSPKNNNPHLLERV